MAEKKESRSATANRELLITRTLNAPVELVWEAWTRPEHIKNWWGPNGFTNTMSVMDLKPGGLWEFVMHGPDGTDYKNKSIFKEVIKHEKIVFEHVAPNFTATIKFTAEGNKTHINWHMLFESEKVFMDVVKLHKADEGQKQNVDKLEVYLANMQQQSQPGQTFKINRTYNASPEKIFEMFSKAEHLAKWWGPTGMQMGVTKLDFRPGGLFHYSMQTPDGHTLWGRFVYREIEAPSKIVFVNSFSDAEGNIIRAPFNAKWPLEVLNHLTLTGHDGKTTLTLEGGPINATDEERQIFNSMFPSMQQGFKGTFDQLEDYLKTAPVIVERAYHAPIEKVWSAITNKDEMKQWYFDVSDFKPEVDFQFSFNGQKEGRDVKHTCRITEVIPGKKLSHTWTYDAYEGESTVIWELSAEGGQTKLKLTHVGLENFPHKDIFNKKNFEQGWTSIIGTSLKQYLEK